MARPTDNRRFPIGLSFMLDIRLSLFAYIHRQTRTNLAERYVVDRLVNDGGWDEVQALLKQEAALKGLAVEDLLKAILEKDPWIVDQLDEDADLSVLLDDLPENIDSEEEE